MQDMEKALHNITEKAKKYDQLIKLFPESSTLHCTFCRKRQEDVKKLVAGPAAFICNECVTLCNEIISDELSK